MSTQHALLLTAKQGSLSLERRSIPTPQPGQLLVKVHAAALNPSDWKIKEYGVLLETYPAVLGNDLSGIVEQVGEGVEGWKSGDRVLFQGNIFDNDTQGFQQYAVVDVRLVAKIPDDLSFSAAATIPVGLAAAVFGLWGDAPVGLGLPPSYDGKPHSEGPAVVIGAATTVGQFAIQVLRISGYSPIIVYASGKHTDHLRSLGATHVIDRATTPIGSLSKEVKLIHAGLINVVYDTVSLDDTQKAAYEVVASNGRIATVQPDAVKNKVHGKTVHFVLGCWFFGGPHQELGYKLYRHLEYLLASGAIVPTAYEELTGGLQGVAEGLERLKADKVSGKKLVALPQETA